MRLNPARWDAANNARVKKPRYIMRLSFADNDQYYFTSHADCPLPPGAVAFPSTIYKRPSGISQRLYKSEGRSDIGAIKVDIIDQGHQVSDLIKQKRDSGVGLNGKKVELLCGFEGHAFDDYVVVSTQIARKVNLKNRRYRFACNDAQRELRKDIFDIVETSLAATIEAPYSAGNLAVAAGSPIITGTNTRWADYISAGFVVEISGGRYTVQSVDSDTQITLTANYSGATQSGLSYRAYSPEIFVSNTNGFSMVQHGVSFSDAPNATVGYLRVEDEIIRYTGMTANSFTGCTRSALNTAAAQHVVDQNSTDRSLPVQEYIYLEMPAVKLALALMTGELYGQGGARLPDGWHLGVDPSFVKEADYTGIGNDWWNPANDAEGIIVRFEDLKRQDGKAFIGKQLMLLLGAFQPVYADGRLGLRRATRSLSSAAHVAVIGVSDLAMKLTDVDLVDALDEVFNYAEINWNYDPILKKTTRTTAVYDPVNSVTFGLGEEKVVTFLGLHGSRHSTDVLQARFDAMHDAFSAPPKRLRLKLKHRWNTLEVGDIVRVQLPGIRDDASGADLDRAFEVESVQVDWGTGDVTVELFGSTGQPGRATFSASSVLPDSVYSSEGVELSTVLPAGAIEVTGGVGHLSLTNMPVGGYEITGGSDMGAASSIFYYLGDLTIDSDVVLKINNNVQLRVMGHFTCNGVIDGVGRGIAGGTVAGGGLGVTESMGGVTERYAVHPEPEGSPTYTLYLSTFSGVRNAGKFSSAPVVHAVYDGQVFQGVSGDLRGTPGANGGDSDVSVYSPPMIEHLPGGQGGGSGAALAVLARGMSFGASGRIDLSGADGEPGTFSSENGAKVSGSGAGGYCGVLSVIVDGADSQFPVITSNVFRADIGSTPVVSNGYVEESRSKKYGNYVGSAPFQSNFYGLYNNGGDAWESAHVVTYVVDNSIRQEDPSTQIVQPPTITRIESGDAHVSTAADGTRKAQIYLEFSPSPNEFLRGHEVQFKKSSDPDSAYIALSGVLSVGVTSALITPPVDGIQYTVRIRAVNRYDKPSEWVYGLVTADGKGVGPGAPSGLVGVSIPNGIRWEWVNAADDDIKYTEVYISGSNNIANAILYDRVNAESYVQDGLSPETNQYCWIFHRDRSGNQGSWYPASPTAGIQGTAGAVAYAEVSNTPAQLADINAGEGSKLASVEQGANVTETRTSADTAAVGGVSSGLVRSGIGVSFRNGFEGSEFDDLLLPANNTKSQSTDAFSGGAAALITCTRANDPTSSGTTDCAYLTVFEQLALQFGGKRIRVTVYAKQPSTNASAEFAVAYSTAEVGNSGWVKFTPTQSYQAFMFEYDVPAPAAGGDDYLGIWSDTSNTSKSVLIDNVVIEIVQAEAELDALQLTNAPAVAGADETKGALEALLEILTGGLKLGGNDAKILLGAATDYLVGAGMFSGMSTPPGGGAAVPAFHVGDPAKKQYLAYTPGGDVEVGRDTILIGVDSFGNSDGQLYIHIPFHSRNTLSILTNGANSAVTTPDGAIKLFLDYSANADASYGYSTANYMMDSSLFFKRPLFDSPVKWRLMFNPLGAINSNNPGDSILEAAFGRRDVDWDGATNTIGFRFYSDIAAGNLNCYIFSRTGTLETEKATSVSIPDANVGYDLYIEYDPVNGAEFFVNGTSVGTITTNLPPTNAYIGSALRLWAYAQAVDTGYTSVKFGESMILKEP